MTTVDFLIIINLQEAKTKLLIKIAIVLSLMAIVSGGLVWLSIVGGIGIGIPIGSLIEKGHYRPNTNTRSYVSMYEHKYTTASTPMGTVFVTAFRQVLHLKNVNYMHVLVLIPGNV